MLKLNNVIKYYGTKCALNDVSLSIPRGEIVGLFGENGAGKTTLMKCIFDFHSYSGEITLDGKAITRKNIAMLSFATSEHSFFPDIDAASHRAFYKEHFPKFNDARFKGLMEFFSLPMHRPIRSLSTGQKNQFEVILALSQGADYIFMDEPFAGNDLFNREDFYKLLAGILDTNETLVLSTHLIDEVSSFIGRAILLKHGRIVGDKSLIELEESGTDLIDYIKSTYDYRTDRVSKALSDITGEEQ